MPEAPRPRSTSAAALSSISLAHRSFPGGAFGSSKAALVSLTRQMALKWAADGIRVNGVSPGPIRAPGEVWRTSEPRLAGEVERIPLRRVGTPGDVGRAVVYLASTDAVYVTGQFIIVDGGSIRTWYLESERDAGATD